MRATTGWRLAAGFAAVTGALAALNRWQRSWGADAAEVAATMPGDELIEAAAEHTRAVDVAVPPRDVWPWLLQLGGDRGGFYSYDWLEDHFGFLLGGPTDLGIHSADHIVASWQRREVGDLVASDAHGTGGWYVTALQPERALVLQMADLRRGAPSRVDQPPYMAFTWSFVLEPVSDWSTKLLVRERVAIGGNGVVRVLAAPMGIVSFIMTRKMLLGIKRRAEGTLTQRPVSAKP